MNTHTYSHVDGGVDVLGAGAVEVLVGTQLRVWVGAVFESEGDRVGAGVGDGPEERGKRGGGGVEVFGEEGVDAVVGEGEGGEIP